VGLFHPTAASRTLARSGGWPLHTGLDLIGRSCPLAVETRFAHRRVDVRDPSPSTSRLCSMRSRDSQGRWLSLPNERSPPRVWCSSRRSPDRCPRLTRRQTLMTFTAEIGTTPKHDLSPRSSPPAHWQPGVWLSHPEGRDGRPARASEPSQNLLEPRMPAPKPSEHPLQRASTPQVPQNRPHVSSKSPRHLQPTKTFHASASRASTPTSPERPADASTPKLWHLGPRRAFDTSTPESLGTSSPRGPSAPRTP
jgi:hypothetical protein